MIAKAIIESHDYNSFNPWQAQIWFKLYHWKKWLKEKLLEWREWWKNLTGLKKIYFILAIFATIMLAYSLYSVFPKFIQEIAEMRASLSDLSLAVFACLSGIGAVFGFYTSIIRTETAEQGLITDRINKAVEGLGKSNLKDHPVVEVRLGALYALERIAQDSIRDHVQIMETLCAYVRHNSPIKDKVKKSKNDINADKRDEASEPIPLRVDIHAAITIIGRRESWTQGKKRIQKEKEQGYYIKLSYCDLHNASLSNAYLAGADLVGANLNGAHLTGADLKGAWLLCASLDGAFLEHSDMRETNLTGTNLNNAKLNNANLTGVRLKGTQLINAQLDKAILTLTAFMKVNMSGARFENANFYKTAILDTNMSKTRLIGANLNLALFVKANMRNAQTNKAFAHTANFSGCDNLTQKQINQMFCGVQDYLLMSETKLPSNRTRPGHWPKTKVSEEVFMKKYQEWAKKQPEHYPLLKTTKTKK